MATNVSDKTMSDAYYTALGKMTFGASHLEEAMVTFTVALSEVTSSQEMDDLDSQLRFDGWAKNTKSLRKLVKKRFTSHHQKQLAPFLVQSDKLREQRNGHTHSLWQKMVDADTGEFAHVLRIRKGRGKTKGKVDISTPDPGKITKLAQELMRCAHEFQNAFQHAWEMDEKIHRWRAMRGD